MDKCERLYRLNYVRSRISEAGTSQQVNKSNARFALIRAEQSLDPNGGGGRHFSGATRNKQISLPSARLLTLTPLLSVAWGGNYSCTYFASIALK